MTKKRKVLPTPIFSPIKPNQANQEYQEINNMEIQLETPPNTDPTQENPTNKKLRNSEECTNSNDKSETILDKDEENDFDNLSSLQKLTFKIESDFPSNETMTTKVFSVLLKNKINFDIGASYIDFSSQKLILAGEQITAKQNKILELLKDKFPITLATSQNHRQSTFWRIFIQSSNTDNNEQRLLNHLCQTLDVTKVKQRTDKYTYWIYLSSFKGLDILFESPALFVDNELFIIIPSLTGTNDPSYEKIFIETSKFKNLPTQTIYNQLRTRYGCISFGRIYSFSKHHHSTNSYAILPKITADNLLKNNCIEIFNRKVQIPIRPVHDTKPTSNNNSTDS